MGLLTAHSFSLRLQVRKWCFASEGSVLMSGAIIGQGAKIKRRGLYYRRKKAIIAEGVNRWWHRGSICCPDLLWQWGLQRWRLMKYSTFLGNTLVGFLAYVCYTFWQNHRQCQPWWWEIPPIDFLFQESGYFYLRRSVFERVSSNRISAQYLTISVRVVRWGLSTLTQSLLFENPWPRVEKVQLAKENTLYEQLDLSPNVLVPAYEAVFLNFLTF